MTISLELLGVAQELRPRLVDWRRGFHRSPETAFEEQRTASTVVAHLESLGMTTTRYGKTGVVGVLGNGASGPTVGLRADMDALPIQSDSGAEYQSTVAGKAHLCGHDAHTAMLMGAAQILCSSDGMRGAVAFVFQPAEEDAAGAAAMIEDGVLEETGIEAMAALHAAPHLSTGEIEVKKGISCATVDWIQIRVVGKGGHAARPHNGVDSVTVAAQVVTALQQVVSRETDPLDAVVVTLGSIHGGSARGAIAPYVDLTGTIRTLSTERREHVRARVGQIARGVAESLGATCEVNFETGCPALINDGEISDLILSSAVDLLGRENCKLGTTTSMGGEDFAYFAERVPASMFRLGTSDGTERTSYSLHHPKFDIDEDALPIGSALLSSFALSYLETAR